MEDQENGSKEREGIDGVKQEKAQYKCLKCQYEWETEPGPVVCPNCGHLYIKWKNYEKKT